MINRGALSSFAASVALLWIAGCATAAPAASSTTATTSAGQATTSGEAEKVRIVNQPGAVVRMDQVLVSGSVTVIEFYADWCGACKIIEKKLLSAIVGKPRIVLRKINIDDDTSAVAKQFDVGALPHVRIFDGKGKLAYVLVGNSTMRAGKLAIEVLARKQRAAD